MSNIVRYGFLMLVLIGLSLTGFWKWAGATFVDDVPTAATKLIGSLIVVTLLIERSIAAINAVVFQPKKRQQEALAREGKASLASKSFATAAEEQALKTKVVTASAELSIIAGEEDKNRAVLGFAFALLLSAAGVRTLSSLLQIDPVGAVGGLSDDFQRHLAHGVDVILTAGLIAGGSDGLAKLLQIIKDGMTPPSKP